MNFIKEQYKIRISKTVVYEGSITAPAFGEADMYSNIEKLFAYLNISFPELQTRPYPISFQIYNKSSNVPEDLSVSYDIQDLQHGTRQSISERYDSIIKQLNIGFVEKEDELTF